MLRARIMAAREAGRDRNAGGACSRRARARASSWPAIGSARRLLAPTRRPPFPPDRASETRQDMLGGAGLWLRAEPGEDRAPGRCARGDRRDRDQGMSRRHLTFACEGSTLVGTLDEASGDNRLAARSAAATNCARAPGRARRSSPRGSRQQGFPVFRFDRRGVGDSEGANGGFREQRRPTSPRRWPRSALRAPQLTRVVGVRQLRRRQRADAGAGRWAATRWSCRIPGRSRATTTRQPPAALRDHYTRPAARPEATEAAADRQGLDRQADRSLSRRCALPRRRPRWRRRWRDGLAGFARPGHVPASPSATAPRSAFLAAWDKADPRIRRCPDASHSYVEPERATWLDAQVLEALNG